MNRSDICDKFIESLPYNPYAFQEEALLAWFDDGGGVLVCAPTGMGKTLIAEAAVFEALHTRRAIYYTTPLIALTDQKYRELQEKAIAWGFPATDVGLVTGNRKENPDAVVRVVVAEILLNHLLAADMARGFEGVDAVVMDEFHSFNDPERGIVWELSLVLLPRHVRVLLLSATVGNPYDFTQWLKKQHGRELALVTSSERRVPLEFHWVEDMLLGELLPAMISEDEASQRAPMLVFCFKRDDCWELAEQLKGQRLIGETQRKQIEAVLDEHADALVEGVGPKLRQMLLRGVGVHHAGVLPRHKELVETLFLRRLAPVVVCTETLAAGINLPARSVVLTTLLKGPPRARTLVPAAAAHQMFGRAGRPQFDTQGHVYAVAHEDDVRINKWKQKLDRLDPNSKDPGILRARKELDRKRPLRRKTEQYWTEGQFRTLIAAGAAKLASSAMIPYQVLIYMLTRTGTLNEVRHFLSTRFTGPERIEKFQRQLEFMIGNLAGLGYLQRPDEEHVQLNESIYRLGLFRSVDPVYGAYLCEVLLQADFDERLLALESVLEFPTALLRRVRIPAERPPGKLEREVLAPMMIAMGVTLARGDDDDDEFDQGQDEPEEHPPTFPEMLKLAFEARLPNPEPVTVHPKWLAPAAFEMDCEFYRFVKAFDLVKQEGIVLRHLLRLAILSGEFFAFSEDPEYKRISELATQTCRRVDPSYTDRFLKDAQASGPALP